jgi:hypothetical protein
MIANSKTKKKQKYNNTVHLTRESSYSNKQQEKEKKENKAKQTKREKKIK